jgi:prepilin-type N-terminal cleavage/methylation domain-containing protein
VISVNNKGFTLIELIVVIAILAILSAIAVPRFSTITENARRDVCEANRHELKHAYEIYLVQNDEADTDINFTAFVNEYDQEICPEGGIISRSEGKIDCSIHFDEDVEETDDSEDDGCVPFL